MTIRSIKANDFYIPPYGNQALHALLHEEVDWYATSDDRVVGIIVRDKIDNDYGFVVLTNYVGPFRCVDVACSMSMHTAIVNLHAAMEAAQR